MHRNVFRPGVARLHERVALGKKAVVLAVGYNGQYLRQVLKLGRLLGRHLDAHAVEKTRIPTSKAHSGTPVFYPTLKELLSVFQVSAMVCDLFPDLSGPARETLVEGLAVGIEGAVAQGGASQHDDETIALHAGIKVRVEVRRPDHAGQQQNNLLCHVIHSHIGPLIVSILTPGATQNVPDFAKKLSVDLFAQAATISSSVEIKALSGNFVAGPRARKFFAWQRR